MGLFRSATGSVGCRPVSRNSSLLTNGCARSCVTGPAPDCGGVKAVERVIHATPGLGAKALGKEAGATAADEGATPRQSMPKTLHAFAKPDIAISSHAAISELVFGCRGCEAVRYQQF